MSVRFEITTEPGTVAPGDLVVLPVVLLTVGWCAFWDWLWRDDDERSRYGYGY